MGRITPQRPLMGASTPPPPDLTSQHAAHRKWKEKEEGRGCGGGGVGYEARAVRVLHWISPGEKPEE